MLFKNRQYIDQSEANKLILAKIRTYLKILVTSHRSDLQKFHKLIFNREPNLHVCSEEVTFAIVLETGTNKYL